MQDVLDSVCKDMHQCLKCVSMDNSVCDPYTVTWSAVLQFGQSLESACVHDDQLEGTCAHGTCCCMIDFYFHFLNNPIAQEAVDETLSHDEGFDHEGVCRTQYPMNHEVECCGLSATTRRPHRVDDGSRTDCCENKNIFNIDRLQCCDDGRVILIGLDCG